ncbi:MAG: alpha/beta hydrolase [Oscillospiraceae bacterium]|nr:alpha/beta hydrolase [Oscillospiraceae bacterium]
MKKALKITGRILLGLLILIAVFLIIMIIYNQVMLKKEDKLLENYPGQLVEVNGHNMNVYIEGEGEHTLVFLAPAGSTSPVLTFKPLYSKLSGEYKTVVVEKFGYGMSDVVDTDRDYKVMVNECREALEKSGVEAPYILCPYSKSGLDALIWAQNYPNEVEGIFGMDMAFPNAMKDFGAGGGEWLISAAKNSGIIRLFISDNEFPETYSTEEKQFAKALFVRKYANKVMPNEIKTAPDAAETILSDSKPEMPLHLLLTSGKGTGREQEWQGYAHSYIDDMKNASVTQIDCAHDDICGGKPDQVCDEIRAFTDELGK